MLRVTVAAGVCALAILLVLAARSPDSAADGGKPPAEPNPLLAAMESADVAEQSRASATLEANRAATIETLIALARRDHTDPRWRNSKMHAVHLLGEFRAVEAIDVLIEQVSYKDILYVNGDQGPYIAAIALQNIGYPVIDAIIRRLDRRVTDEELSLFADVILGIHGREYKRAGLVRLELELERLRRHPVGTRETNLVRLIKCYEGIDVEDGER